MIDTPFFFIVGLVGNIGQGIGWWDTDTLLRGCWVPISVDGSWDFFRVTCLVLCPGTSLLCGFMFTF